MCSSDLSEAITGGLQEYALDGRTYKRAELTEINRRLNRLSAIRARRKTGGIRMRQGVPLR